MDFLAERAPNRSQAWFDGLFAAIESLSEMPLRQALIAESTRLKRPLRALPYRAHRVLYEVEETRKVVSVVRVYHSKRAPLTEDDFS